MSGKPENAIQYDERELRRIAAVIRKMNQEAQDQARSIISDFTSYAVTQIQSAASSHPRPKQARRIAEGISISKTSVIGEISIGFARQKFSGGATTQKNVKRGSGKGILAGVEFGSDRIAHFQPRTARLANSRGSSGYFIYPTLRRIQPNIVRRWEEAFSKVVKEWEN